MKTKSMVVLIMLTLMTLTATYAVNPNEVGKDQAPNSAAVAVVQPAGATPTPDCQLSWQLVPYDPSGAPDRGLFGVAARADNDAWVVGSYGGPHSNIYTEHWDGKAWRLNDSSAPGGNNGLNSVAMVSSNDVWAVGVVGDPFLSLIEHWDGSRWFRVTSPNPPPRVEAELRGVASVAPDNIWAVGSYPIFSGTIGIMQTLIEHWDGSNWHIIPSPSPGPDNNELYSVVVVSSTDVWAAGYQYGSGPYLFEEPLVLHWDGTSWRAVSTPLLPNGGILHSISAVSSTDVWAVGSYDNSSHIYTSLTMHWNGSGWQIVPSPNPTSSGGEIEGVYAIASNDVWAVGGGGLNSPTAAMHWDGSSWQLIPSPSPGALNGLWSVVGLAHDNVWAVGTSYTGGIGDRPIIEHYGYPDACLTPTPSPTASPNPSPTPTMCAMQYRDVGVEYWAYGYIHYLACRGVTAGYPDGSFRPATPISRAEYSKLLALAYGLPLTSPPTPRFRDVPPNHWAYGYIEALAAANISVGYPDGSYRPNARISRAELVKLTVLASGALAYSGPFTDYPDVPPSHWAYQYIKTATHRQWVGGYADGFFRPNAPSSRAELAKLLYLALTFPLR